MNVRDFLRIFFLLLFLFDLFHYDQIHQVEQTLLKSGKLH